MDILEIVKQKVFGWLQFLLKIYQFILTTLGNRKNCNQNYESSAQLFKIWLRYRPTARLGKSCRNDFLCTHHQFTHPNTVLQDCWSLYTITSKEAIFVDSADIDVFSSKYDAFVYNTQL